LFLSLALVLALAVSITALAADADAKKKKKKNRTVTQTQAFSNSTSIQIPGTGTSGPANPYPSTIVVNFAGLSAPKITDVNLTLNGFSHTLPRNVDVLLVQQGRNALVFSDVGGGTPGVSNVTFTLDDEATSSLDPLIAVTSGRFRPTDSDDPDPTGDNFPPPAPTPSGNTALSVFDGANPNGTWQLFVVDDNTGDVGQFAGGWSLEITAQGVVKKKKHKRGGRKR
jgi:hypothetical protein